MPRSVTPKGPSYWHGWSPDGQTLVYCAESEGNFDVYTIPAADGPETRLTTAPGLDDGPERGALVARTEFVRESLREVISEQKRPEIPDRIADRRQIPDDVSPETREVMLRGRGTPCNVAGSREAQL